MLYDTPGDEKKFHCPSKQKYTIGGSKAKSELPLHITAQKTSKSVLKQASAPFSGGA